MRYLALRGLLRGASWPRWKRNRIKTVYRKRVIRGTDETPVVSTEVHSDLRGWFFCVFLGGGGIPICDLKGSGYLSHPDRNLSKFDETRIIAIGLGFSWCVGYSSSGKVRVTRKASTMFFRRVVRSVYKLQLDSRRLRLARSLTSKEVKPTTRPVIVTRK